MRVMAARFDGVFRWRVFRAGHLASQRQHGPRGEAPDVCPEVHIKLLLFGRSVMELNDVGAGDIL